MDQQNIPQEPQGATQQMPQAGMQPPQPVQAAQQAQPAPLPTQPTQAAQAAVQQGVAMAQPTQKSASGMGVAALVLGILSFLASFVPLFNILAIPLVILGLLFAIIGLVGIKRGKSSGKGVTVAGLVLCVLSALVMVVMYGGAAAASSSSSNDAGSDEPATSQPADDQSGADEADAAAAAEGAQEEADAAAGAVAEDQQETAKYTVTIDGATLGEDYEGKRVVIVTFSWVNNSDDATSALVSLTEKAFQNGVELESAIFVDDADTSGWDSEVKPGAGTTFQRSFVLADDSPVTIEVEDPWSWDDELLAEATFKVE